MPNALRWNSTIGIDDAKFLPALVAKRNATSDLNIADGLPIERLKRCNDGMFSDKELASEVGTVVFISYKPRQCRKLC